VAADGTGVSGLAAGGEVFGAVGKMHMGEGTFAEYTAVNATIAARRPADLAVETAAALPIAGGTALAEVEAADIGAGDSVLIVGSGGGVGAFAVQLAARRGARVIAVTSADKADESLALGAADVLDYAAPDLVEQVRGLAPAGVAALIDNFHDAASLVPLAALVRSAGRVVSPVAMGGEEALAGLPVTFHRAQAALDRVAELGDLASRGELRVGIETYPLERVGEALARQATRQVPGKLVVAID
jgi:NADPH:quinone reductase-like Zn-dependent oxidoreductase